MFGIFCLYFVYIVYLFFWYIMHIVNICCIILYYIYTRVGLHIYMCRAIWDRNCELAQKQLQARPKGGTQIIKSQPQIIAKMNENSTQHRHNTGPNINPIFHPKLVQIRPNICPKSMQNRYKIVEKSTQNQLRGRLGARGRF